MGAKKKSEESFVTRAQAAELLGVSTRTVDRYLRGGRLSSQKINRTICLKKGEILKLITRSKVDVSSDYLSTNLSPKSEVDNASEGVQTLSTSEEVSVFEKLYGKLKIELDNQRVITELANKRVHQLEAQLKSSVSILEYQKVQTKSQKEKISKWILILILLILLALQPLWLLKAFE